MNKMFLAIVTSLVLSASLLTMNVAQPVKAVDCHGGFNSIGNVKGNADCLKGNTEYGTECVKWSDEHVTVIDLTCKDQMKTTSNYVAQGYEIKATVGLTMILTK